MGRREDLAAELASGHPDTGAYDADASVAADQLNAVNRSKTQAITSAELLAWSAGASDGDRPRIVKIREAAASHASEAVQALAITADIMISRDSTALDLGLPDRAVMLAGLVAGGVLSAADSTSLTALGSVAISRAEELGLGRVMPGTVQQARA